MDSLLSKAPSCSRAQALETSGTLVPWPITGLLSPCPCSWQASEVGPPLDDLEDEEGKMETGGFLTFLYKLFRDESTG